MFNKIIIVLVGLVLTTGCVTNDDTATNIDIDVNFSLIDQEGNDLLDPSYPGAITEQNTELYYLVGDSLVKQYEGHLTHPKKFYIVPEKSAHTDYNYMRVFTNTIEEKSTATTYIEFEDSTMDTIRTQYEQGDNYTIVTKVWYNGDLKCDYEDKENPDLESNKYGGCYFIITYNGE